MAYEEHGSKTVAIHEHLPLDDLCVDDGISAQDCQVACNLQPRPMATPCVSGDQLAPRLAGYRDVLLPAESRVPQQSTAEKGKKLVPVAPQQLGAAVQSGATAASSIGLVPNSSLWPQQRVPTLDGVASAATSLQPTGAAATAFVHPTVAVAAAPASAATGVAYPLQQRSPSSPWQPALDAAGASSAVAAASAGGIPIERGEATVLHLLNRVRELEETDRRNASREDAYRMQVQNLQARIDVLQADRNSLLAENEQLKNALGAAASAARSMAAAASQQQQQDADSGFPASSVERRSSSSEDSFKRRISDLQQQLELYQDEMQKLYDDNRNLREEKTLLQKRLSASASAGGGGSTAASQHTAKLGLDSGMASSEQGRQSCSSTSSSSQELSVDSIRTILEKVHKSRSTVDELKEVVRRQTDIIKNYKSVIEKTLRQQANSEASVVNGSGATAAAGATSRGTPTKAVIQLWDGSSRLQQQLAQKTAAVSARAAGSGLPATAAGMAAVSPPRASVSPACFSFSMSAGLPAGTASSIAAGGPTAVQPPSLMARVPTSGSRQAVEQSDLSRSLGPCAVAVVSEAATAESSWLKDDELSVGSAPTTLHCSSLSDSAAASNSDSLLSEMAGTIAAAGPRGDAILLPQQPLQAGVGPPTLPEVVPASTFDVLPRPSDKSSGDVVAMQASVGEYRVCPICNARFSSQTPLERLQEHILDCEGTSAPTTPQLQHQRTSSSPPYGNGYAAVTASDASPSAASNERTCPMCCAHFPPELPQREYELHVMAHFDDDFIVAGREPLPLPGIL